MNLSIDAQDGLASALNRPNAQLQPEHHIATATTAPEPDGRPPSIHISGDLPTAPDARASEDESEPEADPSSHGDIDSDAARAMPPTLHISAPAPRPRRMTLDLPSSPIDVLYTTDHKLSLEGTSPKPCIVPGNALHLIDDDPSAPRSATPPSVIIVGDESEHGAEPETDADVEGEGEYEGAGRVRSASQPPTGEGAGNGAGRPPLRVRFRSRVRITSGMHRSRHHHASIADGSTPGSTTSGSPSSSISAPLRYQADENGAWGPIGKRLSAYAAAGGWHRRTQVQVQEPDGQTNGARNGAGRGRGGLRGARGYNERTPLLRPRAERAVDSDVEDEDAREMSEDERTMRASALRREEEAVFGKWPWRIFNRHVSALVHLGLLLCSTAPSGGGGMLSLYYAVVVLTTRTTRSSDSSLDVYSPDTAFKLCSTPPYSLHPIHEYIHARLT